MLTDIKIKTTGPSAHNAEITNGDGQKIEYLTRVQVDLEATELTRVQMTLCAPSIEMHLRRVGVEVVNVREINERLALVGYKLVEVESA